MDWPSIGTNDVTSFLVFGCVHGDMKTFQLASLVGMNATKTSCSSCQCDCGFEAGKKDIVERVHCLHRMLNEVDDERSS
jgi:hypothetical protein